MNRGDRKREKHRMRRQERQKELRLRRERESRKPQVPTQPPADLRGMTAADWADFETLTFPAVFERAREMFPRDSCLKHYLANKPGQRPMRDADADHLKTVFTMAARILRSDPPWHWPYVHWKRDPNLEFFLSWRRRRLVERAEHGRVGFWGLSLRDPGDREVDVGFTHHAIERLTERWCIDHPTAVRALADGWMHFLMPFPEVESIRMDREIVLREGEMVLRIGLRVGDGENELGYFPLAEEDGLVVAKTFLEPWRSGPAPAVHYTESERRGFQERYAAEVVPWIGGFLALIATQTGGRDLFATYTEWLDRGYSDRPARATAWIDAMELGDEMFVAGRFTSARTSLERGLRLLQEEWDRGDPYIRSWVEEPGHQRWLADRRYMLAQTYGIAAVGGVDPDRDAVPPHPAEAARLLARGKALLAEALAVLPDLLDDEARADPDVARLLDPS